VRRARTLGASNGALLVVDNQERKVLAYCGSADFYDDQAQGQVDGVQALRSPGSTLKPAVYALAFDQGRATPRSRLLDLPTNYQGFSPENYDLSYWGESSVHDALAYSRNVPVVRLGQELGLEAVLDGLERAGFSDIRKRREAMGLSVILGGCGVSLEELTRFYSSLARGGQLAPLQYVQEAGESPSVTLFSEGACYLISDILSGLERPDIPQRYLEDTDRPRVAWKTGTSYGRRDAWSIGYTPRYTVGVWMGNFDGRGVPEMSGTSMAVPLLLDVFHAISKGGSWFDLPPGVNERKVCAQSGLSVGPHCQHQIQDFFLTDRSSLQACDRHEVCWISPDSSLRYCPQCLPDSGYAKAVFPRYAPELSLWYEQEGLSVFRAPPHNPACDRRDGGAEGPRILSPSEDFTYYLDPQQPQEIMLQAAADARVNKLYWYVNGRFLKAAGGRSATAPGRLAGMT
jgi:penicillin-binding protein 1C